jgi:hypothetical protein
MPVGLIGTVASTADFTLTRDQLITAAFETAKIKAEDEALSPEQLNIGIIRLGLIVREVDQSGKWVWTIQEAKHLSLAAGVAVYDANNGLPQNISELVSVVYRSANGCDSPPLKILAAESYEDIRNKLETGEPQAVYLTNDINLAQRRLYAWPHLETITAQSKVTGTDTYIYKCIAPHTSSETNKPILGANWRMVWELSSGSTSVWASGSAYTAAESLRMVIKRPIFDFDQAGNTPDFPIQFPRLLMYRLASDLGDVYGIPQEQKDTIMGKIKGSFSDIFASTRPKTNNIHNKATFF